ncbi:MAG: outer membrane beta-barrel protein [Terriglobales bacterium]
MERCFVRGVKVLGWFMLLVLLSPMTMAQTTGRLNGKVTDPTGAVVPDTKITMVSEETGVSRTVQADKDGTYNFIQVPVGNYRLELEHPSFKKSIHRGITILLNQVATLDVVLEVGAAQEVVYVSSEAPLVDTSSTQLGAVVNDRSISQLPLNARDTYQFLQLQPGVQSQTGSDLFYGSDRAGTVSVNGGRGRSNNFNVNGGDANDQFVNLPTVQPSPDSIEEFRVLTNTFDAEYGRNSGAVVNVVTKSGTNQFHGNGYEFFRNKVLNSKGYFDTVKPQFQQNQFGGTFGGPIKKDRAFFFLSYEGRRINQGKSGETVAVPTDAERIGDFSGNGAFGGAITDQFVADVLNSRADPATSQTCPGAIAAAGGVAPAAGANLSDILPNSVIPTACMDPVALNLLKYVPRVNNASGFYQAVPTGKVRQDQGTVKFDYHINSAQNFSAYYYATDEDIFQPFAGFQAAGSDIPGFGSTIGQRYQNVNLSHTWTITNAIVNELRFTYNRESQKTFQHPEKTNLVTDSCDSSVSAFCFTGTSDSAAINALAGSGPRLGITPNLGASREGVPFISVSGGFVIGNNFEGELPQTGNTFQWSDALSWVKGKHTMKFGVDVRRMRFDQFLYYNVSGDYSFYGAGPNSVASVDNYPNYLLGLADSYSQGSAQVERVRNSALYLFGQDSWNIKPNVTLNYGLRWELNTPMADVSGHVQTFRPGQVSTSYPCELSALGAQSFINAGVPNPDCNNTGVIPTGLVVPGDSGIPPAMTQTYYNAFAPRVGLAWSPGWANGALGKLFGGPGKTSIRAGWGLFYNPIEQLVLEQFSAEPPFGGSSYFSNTFFNTPFVGQDSTVNPNPFNGVLDPPRGQSVDWSLFRPILLFGEFQPHMRTQYSAQYNLTIQRELLRDLVLQVGYVGSQGHRLLASHDLNPGNAQTCLDLNSILGDGTCGPFYADSAFTIPAGTTLNTTLHLPYGPQATIPSGTTLANDVTLVGLRPYSSPNCNPITGAGCPQDGVPVFSNIFAEDTIASSSYNSLQMMVEKRFSHGIQLQGAYTWSKSMDWASSFEETVNPFNYKASRALSLFDSRQRFVLSYYWDLPIRKYEGAAGKLLNGWAISGITTFQSGFPIKLQSMNDTELASSIFFSGVATPDQVAPLKLLNPKTDPNNYYFDPNSFADPALGNFGNARRTLCCGPGINNWDFAVHKRTSITETKYVQFQAEFFNLMNHTQFTNPDGNFSDSGIDPNTGLLSGDFGRIKRARDPRLIQFALKFYF